MSGSIKSSNRRILVGYLIFNLILFLYFSGKINSDFDSMKSLVDKILDPKFILVYLLFTISIIFEGVICSEVKAILIFGRLKNPLPGTRAFSKIAKKDPRINFDALKQRFGGKLPGDPKDQNAEWFNLYKKYSSSPIVAEAHRFFLLTRDISALSLILVFMLFIGHLICVTSLQGMLINMLIILIIFLFSLVSSRNYGDAFVANVLVEMLSDKGSKDIP